ncbi:MAG: DUF3782 domain-containing protein [Planctomycetaceae bacterium]|jgi:hypothetical protein|nr:DUF3782 domain-containing protein [Planctomycetaceae bacterium]
MSTNNIPNTTDWTFEKVLFVIEQNAKQWRRESKRLAKRLAERSAEELKELKESLQQSQKQTEDLFKQTDERFKQTDERIKQTDEQIKQTDEQIKQTEELLKQFIKQTDEQFKQNEERFKQTDEQIKRTDEQIKRTSKQLGKLGNRFGSMEEYLVAPGMVRQFNEINYHFSGAVRNYKIYSENKKKIAEIDVMLENDDYILCVEVKTAPEGKDIRKHIERLKIAQRHFKNLRPNEKKIIGAIAGTIFSDEFKKTVIENGLYAITPSGHAFKIDVPEGFQPRIFYRE